LVKGEHMWMITLRPGPLPIEDMDKWQGSSSAFRGGSGVSEVARPTSLIPAKAYAEVTKTVQVHLRLLVNAPGSLVPMYWLYALPTGLPLQLRMTEMNTNMTVMKSLRHDSQNSLSVN